MEGNEQLATIIPMLKAVGGAITPQQYAAPTPCAAFTVLGVLEHMAGLAGGFAPAFRGDPSPTAPAEGAIDVRFQQAMDELLVAVMTPGAMERIVETPFGPMPGAVFSRLVAFDGLVHGWDLASSTGQSWDPSAALVAEVDGFARQAISPELRDGDTFAQEIDPPAGASPLQRLVAFSGRTV
ncbi:MAG: TIGR03086 family metal-binding protein [Actinomycetota bacterium]|nr:TIGR03086 family metal-binding protein [Actinomycetota bacterium]